MLAIAFSMAFGALFSKTWRVHKIFTAQRAIKRKVNPSFSFYCCWYELLQIFLKCDIEGVGTPCSMNIGKRKDEINLFNFTLKWLPMVTNGQVTNVVYWVNHLILYNTFKTKLLRLKVALCYKYSLGQVKCVHS